MNGNRARIKNMITCLQEIDCQMGNGGKHIRKKEKARKKQRVLSGVQEGSKTHRKNILVRINYKIGRKQNACKTEFK